MTRLLFLCSLLLLAHPAVGAELHWSLRPRSHPTVPQLKDAWVRTPVDAFLRARLDREGLRPAPEADRATLIRRLTLDLTGVPPTLEELDTFLHDPAPDAYERLVERLLASPRYGERWGRHWLDVVRYAETEGFEYDRSIPGAWRYRDYVIRSFNADKPFDRFIEEQLAGDEIDPENPELQVAAGFHRLGPVRRNAGNQELAFSRDEVLTETANAVGSAFLALTVGCARCHDHKFDDIPQVDFYRLQAFLAPMQERDIVLASFWQQIIWKAQTAALQTQIKKLQRTLNGKPDAARKTLESRIDGLERSLPPPLPTISTVRDDEARRTPVYVLKRGNIERKGRQVGPRLPSLLMAAEIAELPPETPRPRTLLARWIARSDNPLTARVLANRVWQYHFGRGLVETANDFGVNGSRPSHPELLDYLANELVAGGWHLKPLHRLIVLSSAYRQSSQALDPHGAAKDVDDRLLWHFPRQRLDAEEVRDALLQIAGRLNERTGGPSVVVPVEDDLVRLLYAPSQWTVTPNAAEHDRRSVYLLAKRNLHLPFLETFDQPDAQTSCPRREASTHALQALELLNGKLANDLAASFAHRLEREAGPDPVRQVALAYRLTAGRPPTERETERAIRFLREQPLREFALAMFNLNAFLYVN